MATAALATEIHGALSPCVFHELQQGQVEFLDVLWKLRTMALVNTRVSVPEDGALLWNSEHLSFPFHALSQAYLQGQRACGVMGARCRPNITTFSLPSPDDLQRLLESALGNNVPSVHTIGTGEPLSYPRAEYEYTVVSDWASGKNGQKPVADYDAPYPASQDATAEHRMVHLDHSMFAPEPRLDEKSYRIVTFGEVTLRFLMHAMGEWGAPNGRAILSFQRDSSIRLLPPRQYNRTSKGLDLSKRTDRKLWKDKRTATARELRDLWKRKWATVAATEPFIDLKHGDGVVNPYRVAALRKLWHLSEPVVVRPYVKSGKHVAKGRAQRARVEAKAAACSL